MLEAAGIVEGAERSTEQHIVEAFGRRSTTPCKCDTYVSEATRVARCCNPGTSTLRVSGSSCEVEYLR